MNSPKIGLAISSGATRGAFIPGILKVLRQEAIPIDFVAGSSVGALAAIGVACGVSQETMEAWTLQTKPWQYVVPEFRNGLGVLNCERVIKRMRQVVGDISFSELKIPMAVVALDLATGEDVAIREGSVLDAFRGAVGAPGIFPPLEKNGHYYVDAGLTNALPISTVRGMGADIVVAVDVGPIKHRRMNFLRPKKVRLITRKVRRLSNTARLFIRWAEMLHRNAIDRSIQNQVPEFLFSLNDATERFHITPKISFTSMKSAETLMELGERAALEQVSHIHYAIENWKK